MATGPEHYRDAERNIEYAQGADPGSNSERFHLALAQVHATMALAAATALGTPDGQPCGDADDWNYVASAGLVGMVAPPKSEVQP